MVHKLYIWNYCVKAGDHMFKKFLPTQSALGNAAVDLLPVGCSVCLIVHYECEMDLSVGVYMYLCLPDECAPNPCMNAGECVNSYTCSCTGAAAGFTGNRCETNIGQYFYHRIALAWNQ